MKNRGLALAGAGAVLLAGAGHVRAGMIIYQNNFEQRPLGTEWSSNSNLEQHASFSTFNGRYSDKGVTLSLAAVPPPGGKQAKSISHTGVGGGLVGSIGGGAGGGGGGDDGGGDDGGGAAYILYTLEFDLYVIDSWDGNGPSHGPDALEIRANPDVIFHETFSNGEKPQSFRAPDIGPTQLGYSASWDDSIYRDVRVSFRLGEGYRTLNLTFVGLGLQGVPDESWGIDNITLSYEVTRGVPAPTTLATGAAALLLGTRRRRR